MPRLFYLLISFPLLAQLAHAALLAEYPFLSGPATYSPEFDLWTAMDVPVANESTAQAVTAAGSAAWRIGDLVAAGAGQLPRYRTSLVGPSETELYTKGWSFRTNARLNNDFGSGPAQGLGVYFNDRAYWATVDRTPAGVLQLYLTTSVTGGVRTISNLASGAAASQYFDLELRATPGNQNVAVYWNGAVIDQWAGIATVANHPNLFQFGSQLATGAGEMDYKYVALRSLDPASQGDYNGDGAVSGADYTIWRQNFGSSSNLAADGNANRIIDAADYTFWRDRRTAAATVIPEPSTMMLAMVALYVGASLRDGWARASRRDAAI